MSSDASGIFRQTLDLIERHLERESASPVSVAASPAEVAAELSLGLPRRGLDDEAWTTLLDGVVSATPRTTTRSFFNQLFAGRDAHAVAGEMLASVLNSSMYTYKIAGVHVLIERALTRHMGGKVGYDTDPATGCEGVFAPGGSLAILAGMLMARDAKCPSYQTDGPPAKPLTLYYSDNGHYAVPKNAKMMGLGSKHVRKVATDARGRMLPDALDRAIRDDAESGCTPFLVIATEGTTVLGAYDPLDEIAPVCREHGLWLHADACFGGSAALSSEHRCLLRGSELTDSFSWDAHKMMGVPLVCSVILTREPGRLRSCFNESASYLFQSPEDMKEEDRLNHGTMSPQCGRPNDALKLFAAWQHHGDEGYDRRITHLFDLAQHAAATVEADAGMTLVKRPESVTVCFKVEGITPQELCERMRQEERALVGYAIVDGEPVVRLACVNAENTLEDLDRFFDHVREVAGVGV
ncbi:MAG: pyridoxal-dependent decarboxylase [Planctomycetota bacterium]